MLFSQTIDNIDNEITELLAQIEAKKQHQSQLLELDVLADHTLEELADVVGKVGHYAPDAIASLKTAVLGLFDSGDNGGDGGNQPTDPTPGPDEEEPELLCLNRETGEALTTDNLDEGIANIGSNESQSLEDDKVEADANAVPCAICGADLNDETNYPEYMTAAWKSICRSCEAQAIKAEKAVELPDADNEIDSCTPLTYTQAIKNRCSASFGYEVRSKADIKSGFINRTDLNFMEAVNLERSGREFYETVETYLDRLYYNGQSCEWASPFASPVNFNETKYPEILFIGSRFWSGATWSTGTVLEHKGGVEYRVQIDGAVGEVELDRHQLHYISTNLERQCCDIDQAPKIGQKCDWACQLNFDIPQPKEAPTEMIHTSARTGYLKLKTNGQVLSCYAWFPRKDLAEAWFDWLDGMSLGNPELRLSKRNSSWKYEVKLTGLSMTQIERLSQEDLSRKPSKKKESPAQAAGIEPPSGWRQAQPTEAQVTAEAPKKARITLESSPYNGHVCDVVEVGGNWWTLATPRGDLKYPLDSVEVVDEAVQTAEIEQKAEAIEFNDIVQVTSDGNDCVGLVGSFGRVKVIKGDRLGVEIDEQLVYFNSSELKLKVKAETPSQQQNHPPTADVSISDQEATYLQTNGNYKGLAKQTRQRWEKAGIDPSALIAEMRTKRPTEPAWDAERYNPVLAGVGADDASDF